MKIIVPLLLFVVSCLSPAPAEQPSILLITLDTTRADRLGPYGYAAADTPTWDRLAAEGMVFERAYSSAPITIPAHSTILTGRFTPSHGVRDNGAYIEWDRVSRDRDGFRAWMDEHVLNVGPEVFRARAYGEGA